MREVAAVRPEDEETCLSRLAYPSFPFVSYTPPPQPAHRYPEAGQSTSAISSFDLEMYTIEREYQQLGAKLR